MERLNIDWLTAIVSALRIMLLSFYEHFIASSTKKLEKNCWILNYLSFQLQFMSHGAY